MNISAEQFFAALKADPRDIMPSHDQREVTVWHVVRTREEWGRSTPGWANPEGPESYSLTSRQVHSAPIPASQGDA